MIVVVGVCSAIAVLFKPPTSKQSYRRSIDQKTSVCTKKSSTHPPLPKAIFWQKPEFQGV
jgi:hypothetical protein